jgi:hypothetical protein
MRTTLDIDDDVLAAAKDLARAEGRSMGQIISDLARRGLTQPTFADAGHGGFAEAQAAYTTDDWPIFQRRSGAPVTSDHIRRIEDELDLADATPFDVARNAPRQFEDAVSPASGSRPTSRPDKGSAR